MPQYENIEISVNGFKILTNSVSINDDNALAQDTILGSFTPFDLTPTANVGATIEMNYVVEANNEPNFAVVQSLINPALNIAPTIYNPQLVIVGTLTGWGYLQDYSMQLNPNQVVTAKATYQCFTGVIGNLQNQPSSNLPQYDTLNNTGLAHYWTSEAIYQDLQGNVSATGSVIELDYSFRATWNPIYTIGNQFPIQILLAEMQEDFDVVSEIETHVLYTGTSAFSAFGTYNSFNINNIGFNYNNSPQYSLNLNMGGGVLKSNKIDIRVDNLVTVTNTLSKYY